MLGMLGKLLPSLAIRDILPERVGPREVKLAVPGYAQTDSFSCGAVAAYSIVRTFRQNVSFIDVYNIAQPSPNWGMSAAKVASTLRRFRIGVSVRQSLTFEALTEAIDDGFPIIVSIRNPRSAHGHWVVFYGYGTKPNRVFVSGQARPGFSRQQLAWTDFRRIWEPVGNGLICWGK